MCDVVLVVHVARGAEVDGGAVRARPPDAQNVGGGRGCAASTAGNSAVPGPDGAAVDDAEVVRALVRLKHYVLCTCV